MQLERISSDILALDSAIVQGRSTRRSDDATRKLAQDTLEHLTETSSQWLGNATPIVEELIRAGETESLTDEQFISALEAMSLAMPDLFDRLEWQALAEALEKTMGAAMVNGALDRQREFDRSRKKRK